MSWLAAHVTENPGVSDLDIPLRYEKASLERIPKTLKPAVTEYLNEFWTVAAAGLAPVFLGRSRTGKTMAAAVIARIVHATVPLDVKWCSAPGWAAEPFNQSLDMLRRAPLLVLDDLQAITKESRAFTGLQAVLSSRFDALRPTIITGNIYLPHGKEWETLGDLYGPALARRLQDAGKGFTVLL